MNKRSLFTSWAFSMLMFLSANTLQAQDTCCVALHFENPEVPFVVKTPADAQPVGIITKDLDGHHFLYTACSFIKVVNESSPNMRVRTNGETRLILFDRGEATTYDYIKNEKKQSVFGPKSVNNFKTSIYFGGDLDQNDMWFQLDFNPFNRHAIQVRQYADLANLDRVEVNVAREGQTDSLVTLSTMPIDTLTLYPGETVREACVIRGKSDTLASMTGLNLASHSLLAVEYAVRDENGRVLVQSKHITLEEGIIPVVEEEKPVWPWVLLCLALVGGGVAFYLHRKRKAAERPETDAEKLVRVTKELKQQNKENLAQQKEKYENEIAAMKREQMLSADEKLRCSEERAQKAIAAANAERDQAISEAAAEKAEFLATATAEKEQFLASATAEKEAAIQAAIDAKNEAVATAQADKEAAVQQALDDKEAGIAAAQADKEAAVKAIREQTDNELAVLRAQTDAELDAAHSEVAHYKNVIAINTTGYIDTLSRELELIMGQIVSMRMEASSVGFENNSTNVISHIAAKAADFQRWYQINIVEASQGNEWSANEVQQKLIAQIEPQLANGYSWISELVRFERYSAISYLFASEMQNQGVPVGYLHIVLSNTIAFLGRLGISLQMPALWVDTYNPEIHKLNNTPLINSFFRHSLLEHKSEFNGMVYDVLRPGYSIGGQPKQLMEVCSF